MDAKETIWYAICPKKKMIQLNEFGICFLGACKANLNIYLLFVTHIQNRFLYNCAIPPK